MSATNKIREGYVRDQLLVALRDEVDRQNQTIRFLLDCINLMADSCTDEQDLMFVRDGLQTLLGQTDEVRH